MKNWEKIRGISILKNLWSPKISSKITNKPCLDLNELFAINYANKMYYLIIQNIFMQ
jgi:hypothetical protein